MNIIYTGKQNDFPPQYREKLEGKLQKISKMIERKGEKEAHIIHRQERFLHVVEITINMFDHRIVCYGEDAELLPAVNIAIEKLDKQVVKLREKWRDTKRQASSPEPEALEPASPPAKPKKGQIYRVNHQNGQKPMTLDEAVMEMDGTRNGQPDYLVFRDADSDRLSVILRRQDGNFDLIES
jgi:putative sigma-54 modulation protein